MTFIHEKVKIISRIIFTLPSRFIFGNCIPFSKNILPLFEFYNFKKIFRKRSFLEKEGYVKIPYSLDKSLILEIKKDFNKYITDPNSSYSASNRSKKKIFIKEPLKINGIEKITVSLNETLKEYFDGNFKVLKVSGWRTHYDESRDLKYEKYIYSNYWHYDHYRTDILKIFILLNEITDQNSGSTKIINHSNSNFLSRTLRFLDTSLSNFKLNNYLKKNKELVISCDGKLGDIYIINTAKCLHSATIPSKNKFRDLIQLEVTKSLFDNQDPFEVLKKA